MRGWFVAVLLGLLCIALPATAQMARVRTGEHADFTRIVVQAPGIETWILGRRLDGYELRVGPGTWTYELGGVFDLIPRKRLASIAGDPTTGALRLGIGCACHAIPFEFRPGIVVIDLKDGPPPPGSAAEMPMDDVEPIAPPFFITGQAANTQDAAIPDRPIIGYDWLATRAGPNTPAFTTAVRRALPLPLPTGGVSLDPLRQALLEQMSVGLSTGIIDLADSSGKPALHRSSETSGDWGRVVLGELPEHVENLSIAEDAAMTPRGDPCVPDAELAIQDWGGEGQVADVLAEARSGLVGEFDVPDPVALTAAVKKLVHFGFGAEAKQTLDAFSGDQPGAEVARLRSLARLVDGQTDPDGPFASQVNCDTTAALWGVLSTEGPLAEDSFDEPSMRRGFSALPLHLRRSLGPGLIERLILAGNGSGVAAVRSAMGRGNALKDQPLSVLDARIELAHGNTKDAEAKMTEVMTDPGPATADAVLTLVDARIRQAAPIEREVVTLIEALLQEHAGDDLEPALQRALVLAMFGAEDIAGAFAALAASPSTEPDLWALVAERGGDSALLEHAVLAKGQMVDASAETGRRLAERLLSLGFPDQALLWLGEPGPDWNDERLLLRGQALLAAGDAAAALDTITGQDTPEAQLLRAGAMDELGLSASAAQAWKAAGDMDRALQAALGAGDWAAVAQSGPDMWRATADRLEEGRLASINPQADGALARGAALLDNSEADRASVQALLAAVPVPQAVGTEGE